MESTIVFENLQVAADAVRQGGVVVYAAEGVMGLGCDPFQAASVERLLKIKCRPVDKGLIVLCSTVSHAKRLVALDQCDFEASAGRFWPGPTTLILPARGVPEWVTGGRVSVALRVPDFPALMALVEACDGYLISTSANPAGEVAPKSAGELHPQLLRKIDGILPGEVQGLGGATPIIDARSGGIIRQSSSL